MRAPCTGSVRWFAAAFTAVCVVQAPADATHLDELILFDSKNAEKKFDEGLARRMLGLLNADGRPEIPLVPLVSVDGKKEAADMTGEATNPSFNSRLEELRENGGKLTIMAHGDMGGVMMEGKWVKGFGAGTGHKAKCTKPALAVTAQRTGLTINLIVCQADSAGDGVTSVASSLQSAIQNAGGSVTTMNASKGENRVGVGTTLKMRGRPGYEPTEGEVTAVNAAFDNFQIVGLAFKDQYKKFQEALDAAAPPDAQGSKVIARIFYYGKIGTTIIESAEVEAPAVSKASGFDESRTRVIEDVICSGTCATAVPASSVPALTSLAAGLVLAAAARRRKRLKSCSMFLHAKSSR